MMDAQTLIEVSNFFHPLLRVPNWRLERGQTWCVFGRNGSGKQMVDQLLSGDLTSQSGVAIERAKDALVKMISFEAQQRIYERELKLAASDLISEEESGTRVKDFLPLDALGNPLIERFNLTHRLEAFYRELSTGEGRKLLVVEAILSGASVLVCDNPFDSLDGPSIAALSEALLAASQAGSAVVLLLSNRSDIPDWVEYFAHVDTGDLSLMTGESALARRRSLDRLLDRVQVIQPGIPEDSIPLEDYTAPFIAQLTDCTVQYGGRAVLDKLSLSIAPLQHTLVTGENGAGKSTLLGLITGDCLQCFSNDVVVFGHRRGTGESVWDIKRHLGMVSNDLHRRYSVRCDVLSVVCSGFHDSIGLYDPVSEFQRRLATEWLEAVGMADRAREGFQSLSYGEQRLVLIARAMVKSPLLLVLDEPTQGLDELNRERILSSLEIIESRQHSTLLFVSHREDEHLPIFRQHLHLVMNQATA